MTIYRECPCCGASARFVSKWKLFGYVECKRCRLRTRLTYKAVAERLWNRRYTDKAVQS